MKERMMASEIKPNQSNRFTGPVVINSSDSAHYAVVLDKVRRYLGRDVNDQCSMEGKIETKEIDQKESPQRASDLGSANVSCVAFSSCGKAVVCGCDNGVVCIWRKLGSSSKNKSSSNPWISNYLSNMNNAFNRRSSPRGFIVV